MAHPTIRQATEFPDPPCALGRQSKTATPTHQSFNRFSRPSLRAGAACQNGRDAKPPRVRTRERTPVRDRVRIPKATPPAKTVQSERKTKPDSCSALPRCILLCAPERRVRMGEMQGRQGRGRGSVLQYVTESESRRQRRPLRQCKASAKPNSILVRLCRGASCFARRSGVSEWARCKAAKGEDEGAYSST